MVDVRTFKGAQHTRSHQATGLLELVAVNFSQAYDDVKAHIELQQLGCMPGQGWLFGRAEPATQFGR